MLLSKILLISLFVVTITVAETQLPNVRSSRKWTLLDEVTQFMKKLLQNGDPKNGVPPLDPCSIDKGFFDFNIKYLGMAGSVVNASLTGLSEFVISSASYNVEDESFYVDITFPELVFTSEDYEMTGFMFFSPFKLSGKGKLHMEFFDVRLYGTIFLKQSDDGQAVLLDRFEDHHLQIGRVVSEIEFDNNIDEIVNAMIQDLLPHYINRFHSALLPLYDRRFIDAVNPYLQRALQLQSP